MAITYWNVDHWHDDYWNADYWTEDVAADPVYWHPDYWGLTYWNPNYWAFLDETLILVEQQKAAQLVLSSFITGIDITAEVLPPTAAMTLTSFQADAANDVTITATLETLTLTAIDTTFDAGINRC